MHTERKLPVFKRPKSKRIREQEFVDSFDAETMAEFDDGFEADETPFFDMYRRLERERSLGRDERCD